MTFGGPQNKEPELYFEGSWEPQKDVEQPQQPYMKRPLEELISGVGEGTVNRVFLPPKAIQGHRWFSQSPKREGG